MPDKFLLLAGRRLVRTRFLFALAWLVAGRSDAYRLGVDWRRLEPAFRRLGNVPFGTLVLAPWVESVLVVSGWYIHRFQRFDAAIRDAGEIAA